MTLRRLFVPRVALLVSLFIACEKRDPLKPEPALRAVAAAASGPAPSAPSAANAVAASQSRIDVSWTDNSTNETGFEVHRSTEGPAGTFTLQFSAGARVTTYGDAGLAPSTQYCYRVRAFRTTGSNTSYSQFSATACATTLGPPPPAAPSTANATPLSSSAVSVTWSDNSETESGFRVERSASAGGPWTVVATTSANATSASDAGRTSEQQVCYRVVAFNASGGSGPSNADCTTPPAGPTNLTATPVGPEIDLAWVDNSSAEDGYEVLRDIGWGDFAVVASLPANSTSYRDLGVGGGITYSYRVRAKKDGGLSDLSDAVSAQCVDAACPPTSFCPCALGYMCGPEGLCVAHCDDGLYDGDETDVDCGGDACGACAAGQTCNVHGDCASGICNAGLCQNPGGQP